jgi:hypothetical protein
VLKLASALSDAAVEEIKVAAQASKAVCINIAAP